jgi:hypothetical protein
MHSVNWRDEDGYSNEQLQDHYSPLAQSSASFPSICPRINFLAHHLSIRSASKCASAHWFSRGLVCANGVLQSLIKKIGSEVSAAIGRHRHRRLRQQCLDQLFPGAFRLFEPAKRMALEGRSVKQQVRAILNLHGLPTADFEVALRDCWQNEPAIGQLVTAAQRNGRENTKQWRALDEQTDWSSL